MYDGGIGPSARSRVAYDSMLGDDDSHISIGSKKSARKVPQGPVSVCVFAYRLPLQLTCIRQESTSWYHADFQRRHPCFEGLCAVGQASFGRPVVCTQLSHTATLC